MDLAPQDSRKAASLGLLSVGGGRTAVGKARGIFSLVPLEIDTGHSFLVSVIPPLESVYCGKPVPTSQMRKAGVFSPLRLVTIVTLKQDIPSIVDLWASRQPWSWAQYSVGIIWVACHCS